MYKALQDRLADVMEQATRLQALVTVNGDGLPGMLLARCAVAVDEAAAVLAQHAEALEPRARPKGK